MKDISADLADKANPVIVFEPVTLRTGPVWRAVKIARAALLVWGGLSLAGAAGAAAIFGPTGLEAYLAERPSEVAAAEAPSEPAQPLVARLQGPIAVRTAAIQASPGMQPVAVIPGNLDVRPVPTAAPERPAMALAAPLPVPVPAASAASAEAGAAPGAPAAAPLVEARLPRARPEGERRMAERARPRDGGAELRRDASIERQHDFRRLRRLHDLPRRYAYADGYRPAPRHLYRRPVRLYYLP